MLFVLLYLLGLVIFFAMLAYLHFKKQMPCSLGWAIVCSMVWPGVLLYWLVDLVVWMLLCGWSYLERWWGDPVPMRERS